MFLRLEFLSIFSKCIESFLTTSDSMQYKLNETGNLLYDGQHTFAVLLMKHSVLARIELASTALAKPAGCQGKLFTSSLVPPIDFWGLTRDMN